MFASRCRELAALLLDPVRHQEIDPQMLECHALNAKSARIFEVRRIVVPGLLRALRLLKQFLTCCKESLDAAAKSAS